MQDCTTNYRTMFKRTLAILACLTLVLLLLCACNPVGDSELNRNRQVNSVNHRGYADAPENTLSAFKLSKEKGFDIVECDVRFTKDGVAVLLHDKRVNRTSNGSGSISNMTFKQARSLDFGSWKSNEYVGERIPTFVEFIDLCVELELHPYIEIKNGATIEQVDHLAQIVTDANLSVTWIARNIDYLSELHKLRPDDRLGLLVDIITNKVVLSLLAISKDLIFINANYTFLSNNKILLCKQNNIPLEVWTLDNTHTITHIDIYISGITSNKYNAERLFEQL